MKFTISKNDISDVLAKVQGLTSRKTNLAITECVLIEAGDSGITMTATDLETGFVGEYPAAVESQGKIAINAKKLFEIVRDFPSDDILINEIENRWIEIGNEKVEFHIVGMDPDEFTQMPEAEDAKFFSIESDVLKNMIDKTIYVGTKTDEKRPHINGIYFERIVRDDGKIVKMVSTDGSRLALYQKHYDVDFNMVEGPEILIAKKGLNEVEKFLGSEGKVEVGVWENHFFVKKETETISVRLLEGEFPKYEDILKREESYLIKMDRKTFQMMLKRMSILCFDEYKGVKFHFESGRLTILAANPKIGESREEMEIEFDGTPIDVAFNPRFFIDALGVIEEDIVLIDIVNEMKPCIIQGETDKNFKSVIMPMKI